MANSNKGGMQTSACRFAIYCPKCGKPAARIEFTDYGDAAFLHYTKAGSVWHIRSIYGAWKTSRTLPQQETPQC